MIYQRRIQLINVNRGAAYVNRGFYFQYLTILDQWVFNFISNNDVTVYTEVGNDIKEIGKKLGFTQVKCFYVKFQLYNKNLRNEILIFFVQYLQEKEENPSVEFHFLTNTSYSKQRKITPKMYG